MMTLRFLGVIPYTSSARCADELQPQLEVAATEEVDKPHIVTVVQPRRDFHRHIQHLHITNFNYVQPYGNLFKQ